MKWIIRKKWVSCHQISLILNFFLRPMILILNISSNYKRSRTRNSIKIFTNDFDEWGDRQKKKNWRFRLAFHRCSTSMTLEWFNVQVIKVIKTQYVFVFYRQSIKLLSRVSSSQRQVSGARSDNAVHNMRKDN